MSSMSKLYLAGIYTSNFAKTSQLYHRLDPREKAARDGVKHILESYHYIHKQSYVDKIRADGVQVFLDSGAFSAFSKGAEVDLPAYCEYILRNKDIILHEDGVCLASVLDGIGDPLKTWQNQMAMESLGVRPLPCFHYGEDERYLEYYMANYPYITLGGMVPISTAQLLHWLDRLWEKYLTDGSGRPKLKVHGFGLTTQVLMDRYPWWSIDSSTWVQNAAMGYVFIPGHGSISVSSQSPDAKKIGKHLHTVSPMTRAAIEAKIRGLGFDPDKLSEHYLARWAFNCWSFTQRGDDLEGREPVFKPVKMELF